MDEKKVRAAIYCMKSFADDTVCEECDNYDRCDHTMVADNAKIAIKALEKQLPKKPIIHSLFKGEAHFDCPECGTSFVGCTCDTIYCSCCGCKFDWSESSER